MGVTAKHELWEMLESCYILHMTSTPWDIWDVRKQRDSVALFLEGPKSITIQHLGNRDSHRFSPFNTAVCAGCWVPTLKDVLYDNREVVSRAERYHLPAQAAIDARVLERCGLVGIRLGEILAIWPSNSSRHWADRKRALLVNGTCHVTGKLENIDL